MRLAASAVSLASSRFARAATSRVAARRANRAARPARRPLAAPRAAASSSSAGEEPESSGATVPFDETEGGEGASGHDVVEKERSPAPPPSPTAPPTTSPPAPAGWGATPEDAGAPGAPGPSLSDASVSPGAYFRGRAGYSKFYPPDAREATFARHLMVAVDDSEASEAAVRWSIANLCRSGDLLHVVHVSAAGEADPRALPGYVGPPDPRGVVEAEVGSPVDFVPGFGPPSVSASAARHRRMIGDEWAPKALHGVRVRAPETRRASFVFSLTARFPPPRVSPDGASRSRTFPPEKIKRLFFATARSLPQAMAFALDADTQDAYWSAAVLRTEAMLDDIFDRVKKNHGAFFPETFSSLLSTFVEGPPARSFDPVNSFDRLFFR